MASLSELRSPVPTNGSVSAFSLPASIGVKRGPQGIPTVQTLQNPSLHNRVKEPMVNSTAAKPYLIRKYSREYETYFQQGDLMFVKRDDTQDYNMSRGVFHFSNLPLVNYLLKKKANANAQEAMNEAMNYAFIGIMENKMKTGKGMDDMILVNVRGRARCCNMWIHPNNSKQLTKGTVVYLKLSLKKATDSEVITDPLGYRDGSVVNANHFYCQYECSTNTGKNENETILSMVPVGVVSLNNRPRRPKQETVNDAHHQIQKYRELMNHHPIEIFMRV